MKINKTMALVLGLAGIVSVQNTSAQFKVVGYSAYWESAPSATQYGQVTHINYAFLAPNSNGSLQAVPNLSQMQGIISSGHAKGVKVLISCQTSAATFATLAASSSARSAFANNLVNLCNQYGLDGVDIDWEFPSTGTQANNYQSMMSTLSTALHNDGKLLTAAVIAWGGDSILGGVFSSVDWLNIMDYDNSNGVGQSTYDSVNTCLNYWVTQRGLPISKAVMGVPFYGDPNGQYTYAQLLSMGASPNSDSWNGYGYNGIPTIQSKTSLCMQQGLGGMMIWTLGGDATGVNSLLTAMYSTIHSSSGNMPTGGNYVFYNANSGKALDDTGGSTSNGTIMQQWTPSNGDANQEWVLNSWGNGYYGIKNLHSGLVLDDTGGSTSNGTFIQQWAQNGSGSANQEWKFIPNPDGTFQIQNKQSGKDLQIANFGTADGAQATQWSWGNNTSQEWWVFLNGVNQ